MERVQPITLTVSPMDDTAEAITGRVRALRKRAGFSMGEFAKKLGYKAASSVQRYENPEEYQGGYLRRELVSSIEKALIRRGSPPISREEIWELAGPEFAATPAEPTNALIGPKTRGDAVTIPLYGQAVGGVDGEFVLNEGNKLADIFAPRELESVSGAYAVTVSGESMTPRYDDGEVVYVHPTERPVRGDYVVAQIHNPNEGPPLAYVKRLIRHNEGGLVLEQLNPPKELRFEHRAVVSVHLILLGGRKLINRW